jgi:hypothetical protein
MHRVVVEKKPPQHPVDLFHKSFTLYSIRSNYWRRIIRGGVCGNIKMKARQLKLS